MQTGGFGQTETMLSTYYTRPRTVLWRFDLSHAPEKMSQVLNQRNVLLPPHLSGFSLSLNDHFIKTLALFSMMVAVRVSMVSDELEPPNHLADSEEANRLGRDDADGGECGGIHVA